MCIKSLFICIHYLYTDLVGSIKDSHNLEVYDGSRLELQHLPGAAWLSCFVCHHLPVAAVHGAVDVVAVTPLVAVPQQQSGGGGRFEWRNKGYLLVESKDNIR